MLMKLLLFEATAISLVECFLFGGCNYNPLDLRTDLEPLCWKWWDKAVKYKYKDSSRGDCVNLIKEKCPNMITVERLRIRRSYDSGQYEKWSQDVRATLKSETSAWRSVTYLDKQEHEVCWDNNGKEPNCDYWWSVAKKERAQNEFKERCIDRILNHCPSMLRKVSENRDCTVQRCRKGYDVKLSLTKGGTLETRLHSTVTTRQNSLKELNISL